MTHFFFHGDVKDTWLERKQVDLSERQHTRGPLCHVQTVKAINVLGINIKVVVAAAFFFILLCKQTTEIQCKKTDCIFHLFISLLVNQGGKVLKVLQPGSTCHLQNEP